MGIPLSLIPAGLSPRSAELRQHLAEQNHRAEALRAIRHATIVRWLDIEELPDHRRIPLCIRISKREARRLLQAHGQKLLFEAFGPRWARICTVCISPF